MMLAAAIVGSEGLSLSKSAMRDGRVDNDDKLALAQLEAAYDGR